MNTSERTYTREQILREALAKISLSEQNNCSPAHIKMAEAGRIARAALASTADRIDGYDSDNLNESSDC